MNHSSNAMKSAVILRIQNARYLQSVAAEQGDLAALADYRRAEIEAFAQLMTLEMAWAANLDMAVA